MTPWRVRLGHEAEADFVEISSSIARLLSR